MGTPVLASLADIITGIGSVSTWFWSLFTDLGLNLFVSCVDDYLIGGSL